jgi:hypothetical protein
LPRNTAGLDEVEGILTASSIIIKAARPVALQAGLILAAPAWWGRRHSS